MLNKPMLNKPMFNNPRLDKSEQWLLWFAAILIGAVFSTNTQLYAATSHSVNTNATTENCITEQQWWLPNENKEISRTDLLKNVSSKRAILLGEHHSNEQHHQWHLQTIESLFSIKKDLILGFEMFPRRLQPVLDQWVKGKLTEKEFLQKLDWDSFWGFDVSLYMPIFNFAKNNNLPMRALNVNRSLRDKVRKNGWKAVPENEKEGLSDPATPSVDYLNLLAASYLRHNPLISTDDIKEDGEKFFLFVQGQLLWDRAMAEGVVSATKTIDGSLFIGIMGSWHIINRLGVPHQMASLGLNDAVVLVPWDRHFECTQITASFADAIYGTRLD